MRARIGAAVILGLALLGAAALAGLLAKGVWAAPEERVVTISAMKFDFVPDKVTLKRGEPVILELSSLDRTHGFTIPELGVRADIPESGSARVRVMPDHVGSFAFRCDLFCGSGHEEMEAVIEVIP
jgi:cytochrome c oxidase subunit 2